MTTKLYDVFSALTNSPEATTFVMRAPMATIAMMLNCHGDAVRRMEQEFKAGEVVATLHHNGRGSFAHLIHFVQPAVGALSDYLPDSNNSPAS